ncbi:MAG: hypothetical protein JWN22_2414 [Nocardioides sp.]|jgi:hypothetical protein|nr:hypothetical protein [Nocardioides sp.]
MTATALLPTGLVHAGVWPVVQHPDVELLRGILESVATLAGDPGLEGRRRTPTGSTSWGCSSGSRVRRPPHRPG